MKMDTLLLTLLATLFTFSLTTIGASIVFIFKKVNKNILDIMLSLSSGIMIAASFFSLISPAIALASSLNLNVAFVLTIGFILGGIFLYITGTLFDKVLRNKSDKLSLKRCIMLFLSITIHNIPEGMVIGVAFASAALGLDNATVSGATILALGIGIQNFPEGCAVSLPLRREGMKRSKAFLFGSISGAIEIFAGLLGVILVFWIQVLLPYLLAFASGAMIYVVVQDLIPEAQTNKNKDLMALFTMIGFAIMMVLDISLG